MDSSNLRVFSMRLQKLKNNPNYPSASGCAGPENALDLPRRPGDLFSRSIKIFYNIFHKKSCQNWKKMIVQFFVPDADES